MKRFLLLTGAFVCMYSFSSAQTTVDPTNVGTTPNETTKVGVTSNANAIVIDANNPYQIKDNSNLVFINKEDNPGPVYVNTGNVELDTKNYVIAKEAWIKENTIPKENTENPK